MNYFVTAIILMLKEIGIFESIKRKVHKTSKYKKPYDCFFCLSIWCNIIATIIIISYTGNLYYLSEFGIAILISKIIDLQWN